MPRRNRSPKRSSSARRSTRRSDDRWRDPRRAQGHEALRRPRRGERGRLRHPAAVHREPHRTERRWEDDVLQPHRRAVQADQRIDHLRRSARRPAAHAPDHAPRHRANLPEHQAVPEHDRAREHHGRAAHTYACQPVRRDPAPPERAPRGTRHRRSRTRDPRLRRAGRTGERVRQEPPLWRPAPARNRACARDGAEAPTARRAHGRDESARDGAADGLHSQAARRPRRDDPADRARHEGRHGDLGACHGARSRRQDRRRDTASRAARSAGHRGVSRTGEDSVSAEVAAERPVLELTDVNTYYGNIQALKGVSLSVNQGEVVTLIGSNGAGKTTTLRTISGILRPRKGSVRMGDQDLTKISANEVVRLGIAHSPEGRRIFARMSVKENLEMGAYARRVSDLGSDYERVYTLFPRIKERLKQRAGTLSGGEQQMLAIGRALMARPKLLLLGEPSMGLAPVLVELVFKTIQEINAQGMTVLLVEQNAHMALSIANRGYVLQTGTIVLTDTAKSLAQNEMVRKAYLGEE